MIYGTEASDVDPINGRVPVLVTDYDDDAHVHFLALAPAGVSVEDARKSITDAYSLAREENEDEWNYGDVKEILAAQGFDCHAVAVWEEQCHG